MTALAFIVLCLATFRITRNITTDAFPFAELREVYVQRWGVYDDVASKSVAIGGKPTNWLMRKIAYLWECDWCTSVWVASILTWITVQFMSVPLPVFTALAASAVTGLIAQRQPD